MPQLEAISLNEPDEAHADNVVAELPPLRKLRGLYLWQRAHRYRGINRLTSLESLRIGEGCIDDTVLQEIAALPNLRALALDGMPESTDLSFLPSQPQLSSLQLYYGKVSGDALQNIGHCPRLKELSLYMCHVDGTGIRHLSSLANLETLDLQYTNVTSRDLAELATLKRLRQLELTGTKVGGDFDFMSSLESLETLVLYSTNVNGGDLESLIGLKYLRRLNLGYTNIGAIGITHLRRMNQLKWVRVSIGGDVERKALQAALPDCEVQFH